MTEGVYLHPRKNTKEHEFVWMNPLFWGPGQSVACVITCYFVDVGGME